MQYIQSYEMLRCVRARSSSGLFFLSSHVFSLPTVMEAWGAAALEENGRDRRALANAQTHTTGVKP